MSVAKTKPSFSASRLAKPTPTVPSDAAATTALAARRGPSGRSGTPRSQAIRAISSDVSGPTLRASSTYWCASGCATGGAAVSVRRPPAGVDTAEDAAPRRVSSRADLEARERHRLPAHLGDAPEVALPRPLLGAEALEMRRRHLHVEHFDSRA